MQSSLPTSLENRLALVPTASTATAGFGASRRCRSSRVGDLQVPDTPLCHCARKPDPLRRSTQPFLLSTNLGNAIRTFVRLHLWIISGVLTDISSADESLVGSKSGSAALHYSSTQKMLMPDLED